MAYFVVTSLPEAAQLLGLPEAELWEGVDSPCHVWHAPGGQTSGEAATLVAYRVTEVAMNTDLEAGDRAYLIEVATEGADHWIDHYTGEGE